MTVAELNHRFSLHDAPIDRLIYDQDAAALHLDLSAIERVANEDILVGRLSFLGIDNFVFIPNPNCPDPDQQREFNYLNFAVPDEGGDFVSVSDAIKR